MFKNDIFNPNQTVIRESVKYQNVNYVRSNRDFSTLEEYLFYLTHEVSNKTHEDGRIYMERRENGDLFANSVSPHSKIFLDNIEPKVKKLINELIKKRYLPYSSCQGHGYSFRRYVGLAFADKESRQYVADYILSKNINGVEVKFLDNVVNQSIDFSYKNKVKYENKISQTEENKEMETKTFNVQFHKNYEEYFFLEIIILKEMDLFTDLFKNPFSFFKNIYYKKYKWDKITKKVEEAIASNEFKKYKF